MDIAKQWNDRTEKEKEVLFDKTFRLLSVGISKMMELLVSPDKKSWVGPLFANPLIRIRPDVLDKHIQKAKKDITEELIANGGSVYDAIDVLLTNLQLGFSVELEASEDIPYPPKEIQSYILCAYWSALVAIKKT